MPSHTNRSIINYSESGGAKTSQISYLARRVWSQHRKRTRLISADGGSWAPIQPEIDAGLIEAWAVPAMVQQPDNKTVDHSIAIFRKLSLGYWPEIVAGKLMLKPPTPQTYEEFGLLAWDGMTAVAERIFKDFMNKGVRLGKDDAVSLVKEGDASTGGEESVYAPTQGHYNFTQKEIRMYVDNSNSLPFDRTYWTALESKGEDVVGKETIYGPLSVGSAMTSKCPAWFGDCFHSEVLFTPQLDRAGKAVLDPVMKVPILEKKIRVYYNDHLDAKTQFKYKAKPRVPPSLYPELEKKFPGGFFDLTPDRGIDIFLDFEDEMLTRAGESLGKLKFNLKDFKEELAKHRATPTLSQPATPAPKV